MNTATVYLHTFDNSPELKFGELKFNGTKGGQILATTRSILSRKKAFQTIKTFYTSLKGANEENVNIEAGVVEAVLPQVEQQVVEPVGVPEKTPISPSSITEEKHTIVPSILGARVVKMDSKVFNLLKAGEGVVDKPFSVGENSNIPTEQVVEQQVIEPITPKEQEYTEAASDLQPTMGVLEPIPVSEPLPEIALPTLEESVPVVDTNDNVESSLEPSVSSSVESNETYQTEPSYLQPMDIPVDVQDRLVKTEEEEVETKVEQSQSQDHTSALESLKSIVKENAELRENNVVLSERTKELEDQVSSKDGDLVKTKEELNVAKSEIIEFGEAAKRLKLENDRLNQELTQTKLQLDQMTEAINSALNGYQKVA